jgi:hypothetical protein
LSRRMSERRSKTMMPSRRRAARYATAMRTLH